MLDKRDVMLSIIVPVYNVKPYLDKCVASILNQSFADFELILVDDGSTDCSGEMCDVYKSKDCRIKVIHQRNQGQAVARNRAIKEAKGDYLGFVDSDDWIEPDMYKLLLDTANETKADIVICRLQRIGVEGEILEITGYDKYVQMNRTQATCEILKDDVLRSYPVNKLYKKSLFDNIEFPANRYFEDTATIYKLIYQSDIVATTPYIGYNYRFNVTSTCNNKVVDYSKQVKREYDNALAFAERYMFCKSDDNLRDVRHICANKAYMRMRSFIHLQVHKGFELSEKQKKEIDMIMKSFSLDDLRDFSIGQKVDAIAYKYCKPLLYAYLRVLALIHPMSRDL